MVFEITPKNIEVLTDTDLRTLIGKPKDGGIDVRVDLPSPIIKGFTPCAKTGFQVKAEDMPRMAIIREMRPGGNVRPSIIRLGELGGAYVIVRQ